MSTPVAPTVTAPAADTRRTALLRARISLVIGAASALALAATVLFVPLSPDDGPFHHVGDYLVTALGIPFVLAPALLLPALRTLQRRRDGHPGGQAGVVVTDVGAVVLLGMFVWGVIAADGGSLGPTYVLASAATIIGVVLFAIGSWRAGLLPRWLLVVWPLAWTVGGLLPILTPGPLLLAAVYLVMAVLLPRRAAVPSTSS